MNESTALTVGLGVAIVVAGVWRAALAGVAVALVASTVTLVVYVVHDLIGGEVTVERVTTHIPLILATILAAVLLVRDLRGPGGRRGTGSVTPAVDDRERHNYAA